MTAWKSERAWMSATAGKPAIRETQTIADTPQKQ
jgi:hypothetical protein